MPQKTMADVIKQQKYAAAQLERMKKLRETFEVYCDSVELHEKDVVHFLRWAEEYLNCPMGAPMSVSTPVDSQ